MPLDFYMAQASPPCRTVWMVLKYLDIDYTEKPITSPQDLKAEAFLKINPRGRMPAIVDGQDVITESRAIALYLINKYGGAKAEELYPKDPLKRARVDELLFWDASFLTVRVINWMRPQLFMGEGPDAAKGAEVNKALTELEATLSDGRQYVAGPSLTLADLAIIAPVSFLWLKDFDISAFPKVNGWMERVKKTLPFYEETFAGTVGWKEKLNNA